MLCRNRWLFSITWYFSLWFKELSLAANLWAKQHSIIWFVRWNFLDKITLAIRSDWSWSGVAYLYGMVCNVSGWLQWQFTLCIFRILWTPLKYLNWLNCSLLSLSLVWYPKSYKQNEHLSAVRWFVQLNCYELITDDVRPYNDKYRQLHEQRHIFVKKMMIAILLISIFTMCNISIVWNYGNFVFIALVTTLDKKRVYACVFGVPLCLYQILCAQLC